MSPARDLPARLERQRARIADLRRENAALRAAGERRASDADLDYLFVVTYGRSGSTLLLGLLNSTPGYLLRGENRGALYRLYQFQKHLTSASTRFSKDEPLTSKDAWFGIDLFDPQQSLSVLRRTALDVVFTPEPDTRVTGFKEIRWFQKDWRDYVAFLDAAFPGARYVVNTRDLEAVSRSDWWGRDQENSLEALRGYDAQVRDFARDAGDRAYHVHFDDYIEDPDRLAGLFEWLGEPFDRSRIDSVLSIRHSFDWKRQAELAAAEETVATDE